MAKKKPAQTVKKTRAKLRIPVDFGTVSIGPKSLGLGASISRANIDTAKMEEFFCGRRLKIRIGIGAMDGENQRVMFDDMDESIEATADVIRYGASPASFHIRLVFNKTDLDFKRIGLFVKKSGGLEILTSQDAPKDEKTESEPDQTELDLNDENESED